MTRANPEHVTHLVNRVSQGDTDAAEELLPLIYDVLHSLAARHMAIENPGHTLQATELVHETYLRLVGIEDASWDSRGHFYKMASIAMRRLLVDHAKKKRRWKAGGEWTRVSLSDGTQTESDGVDHDILEVDAALELLHRYDEELAHIVQLRFFGGLAMDEIAGVLGMPLRTVERRWTAAKLWLRDKLE